ncbi:hypothetical protein BD626DRAFT_458277 [Schizophyllum amplum]|uniref:SET domain-containing protein n=1 Tax=Schizophyllum amplum TaxID=97359 RepID=A0A550CCU3_9AGAR|nr:hypothetical protein BD626DRAFT_458277 [Auriculariopsis ampla]
MSFSDLRAARQSKNARAFAAQSQAQQVNASPSPKQDKTESQEPSADAETLLDLYDLPDALTIRVVPREGRGIWSKHFIKRGSVILSVKPHTSVLSTPNLASYCSHCFEAASEAGLKRCARCRIVHYCTSGCQTADWTIHKRECAALQDWATHAPSAEVSVPSDAVRCLGRLLWAQQTEGPGSPCSKQVAAMQSNRKSLQPSAFEFHANLSHFLVRYLGISSPDGLQEFGIASSSDLVDLTSRFATNSYTVTTPDLTPVGACVSPVVALINHSCSPNAVVVFPRTSRVPLTEEPNMIVVALRDIQPDEQVLTSYIDTTLPRSMRRRELLDAYSFSCQCTLCTASSVVDPREALWCPKSCGGNCPLPTEENSLSQCARCKTAVKDTDAVLDAVRVGQQGLDKANSLQTKDPAKAVQLTTNLMPILISAKLTPSSHPLLGLSRLHQTLLISAFSASPTQDVLDEAIRTATRNTTGLSMILDEGHPVRGVALAEAGKLLAVDELEAKKPSAMPFERQDAFPPTGPPRLKLAYETLQRAREELLIGFSRAMEGGQVGREVRDALAALEKEMDVWKGGLRNAVNDLPRGS